MFRIGDHIGLYFLLKKIGRGAFGEVWLAEEKTAISVHRVALKLPNEDAIDLDAIRKEASVWESVKGHPNILPIIKADIIDEQVYIASEYAPDGPLSNWLKTHNGRAPSFEIAIKLIQGVLTGLGHLHSKGVIHRDLKPENILLQSETPRIADFGIARLIKSTSSTNQVTGTPAYMAPECFYSVRSIQTDIWAVGVIFYLLLSGKLPFPQPNHVSMMNSILNVDPQIKTDIPLQFRRILERILQKNPAHRYQTTDEALIDLKRMKFDSGDTIAVAPLPSEYWDFEQETMVTSGGRYHNIKGLKKFIKAGAISLGLLSVLSLGIVLAMTQFRNNPTSSQEPGPSSVKDFPLASEVPNAALQTSGEGIVLGTNSNTEIQFSPLPESLDDYYYLRPGPAITPGIPPEYERPDGGVVTIDPNSGGSQFMPSDSGIVLCPVPVDENDQPVPAKTPPGEDNVNTSPAPAATPGTQPKTTGTPAAKPTPKTGPAPAKTPPGGKKPQSGKTQDSEE